jgi:hypothetical protein
VGIRAAGDPFVMGVLFDDGVTRLSTSLWIVVSRSSLTGFGATVVVVVDVPEPGMGGGGGAGITTVPGGGGGAGG